MSDLVDLIQDTVTVDDVQQLVSKFKAHPGWGGRTRMSGTHDRVLFDQTDAGVYASPNDGTTAPSRVLVDNYDLLIGMIVPFSGSIGALPPVWHVCDGTGGTPDLRNRFLVGAGGLYALGATGGSATLNLEHQHAMAHTHLHSHDMTHSHSHSHGMTHSHTHSHSMSHTHLMAHTHSMSHTHTMAHAHAMAHTHTIAHTHTMAHAHSMSHTHTMAHTHSHAHTHSLSAHTHTNPHAHSMSHNHSLAHTHSHVHTNGNLYVPAHSHGSGSYTASGTYTSGYESGYTQVDPSAVSQVYVGAISHTHNTYVLANIAGTSEAYPAEFVYGGMGTDATAASVANTGLDSTSGATGGSNAPNSDGPNTPNTGASSAGNTGAESVANTGTDSIGGATGGSNAPNTGAESAATTGFDSTGGATGGSNAASTGGVSTPDTGGVSTSSTGAESSPTTGTDSTASSVASTGTDATGASSVTTASNAQPSSAASTGFAGSTVTSILPPYVAVYYLMKIA